MTSSPPPSGQQWITLDQLAHDREVDRSNAYRWVCAEEKKHNVKLTRMDGRRLLVSVAGLHRIARPSPEVEIQRLKGRMAISEESIREQDQRINGLSRDLFELRKVVREMRAVVGARASVRK